MIQSKIENFISWNKRVFKLFSEKLESIQAFL